MSEQNYDIAIIGSGPGGYTAAIRAAQLKMKVALIEKHFLGGSCLNVGCIPTKAILSSADVLDIINKSASFGIKTENISLDIEKIIERKNAIVQTLRSGLKSLILANKINIIESEANFIDKNTLETNNKEIIKAKNIVIATGSQIIKIPNIKVDHKLIFNSNSLLCHKKLPKTLVIIGGGYIGCEFASFYARLGSKVTIIENLDSIISSQGKDISNLLLQEFKKTDIDVKTNTSVTKCEQTESKVQVFLNNDEIINAETVLIATGRKPYIENLNLEKLNINIGKNNEIIVNDQMQTSIPNIYAIGDVTGKWMLAHTASHEAIVAIDTIANIKNKMSFNAIPTIIFTKPEIASVGLSLDKAKNQNMNVKIGKFPFTALGKAHASGEKIGFVQVIIDKKTKIILGAQAIGHSASVLIAEMALAIQNKLTTKAVMETIHAHPTMSESWLEAVFISQNRALNFFPNVKL